MPFTEEQLTAMRGGLTKLIKKSRSWLNSKNETRFNPFAFGVGLGPI